MAHMQVKRNLRIQYTYLSEKYKEFLIQVTFIKYYVTNIPFTWKEIKSTIS